MKRILISFLFLVFGLGGFALATPYGDALKAERLGNYEKAHRLFLALAKQGKASSQYKVGRLYARGRGVERDYREAAKWYGLAVAQGYSLAEVRLGSLYASGKGVTKDVPRALALFRKASAKGSIGAQYFLGVMHQKGTGVERNQFKAAQWFRKAATMGQVNAQFSLGFSYNKGRGVRKSYREALKWFRLAANQKHAPSMGMLGAHYRSGWGVRRSNVRAYMWFALAVKHGSKSSRRARDRIKGRMSRQQLSTATTLVRFWKPKSNGLIKISQQLLTRLGYKVGIVDGKPSGRVRRAVLNYQRDKGLTETGRVSTSLIKAMLADLGGSTPSTVDANRFKAPPRRNNTANRRPPKDDGFGRRPRRNNATNRRPPIDDGFGRRSGGDSDNRDGRFATRRNDRNNFRPNRSNGRRNRPGSRRTRTSTGTGFVISTTGHILTNRHVVNRCRSLTIRWADGDEGVAKILKISKNADLALLKTNHKITKIAKFRTGKPLRQGEDIAVYGFPLTGLLSASGNLTTGSVAALAGLRDDASIMQISAPVQPGNSGGPVFDNFGRIVGVVVSKLNAVKVSRLLKDIPQNINFAIKGSVATNFLESRGVAYEVEPNGEKKSNADNAQAAKAYTVRIKCSR